MKALRLCLVFTFILWVFPTFAQVPTKLLMEQAEQGNALSQYMLGVAYAIGEGFPKDIAKAAYWMEKAANQDVSEAQVLLGTYYAKGEGVPKDYSKAAQWLKKASDNGSGEGKTLLAAFYFGGRGVSRDKQTGCKLLREATRLEGKHKDMAIELYNEYCGSR